MGLVSLPQGFAQRRDCFGGRWLLTLSRRTMDDRGQFGCVIWDLAQLTLVIAICGVQHRLIGDLHGAGVVCSEHVLRGQSPLRPESKIVTTFELLDLCDQLIA